MKAAVPEKSGESTEADVERRMRHMTRRSFAVGAFAAAAGVATWKWLISRPREDGLEWPFRRVLQQNERLSTAYFSPGRLSPTFDRNEVTRARVNGHLGLTPEIDVAAWRLHIEGTADGNPVELTLDEIRSMPRTEMTTELRCIEGWSIIVHWAGTRLADLMQLHPPATRDGSVPDVVSRPEKLVPFVAMTTPGNGYYVGLDIESAIHPQTLLAYEMNGQPLDWHHGAPLRLAIPVKYGIKNIKRIGTIRYSADRPPDYWARQGYDWYAGH